MAEMNYKSLFILRVFFYCFWEPKPCYDIGKEDFYYNSSASPGFIIENLETGYYQSLALAEKRIRQLAKNKQSKVYCFLVEEIPLDFPLGYHARLSVRRYLGNGKLWLSSDVSNIYYKGRKRSPLGNVVFRGRDPKTILFEEGDFVEVVRESGVELAVVWKTPATAEQMNKFYERERLRKKNEPRYQCIENLEDTYTLVGYSESENGKVSNRCFDGLAVDVLPPSLPVSGKVAKELRYQLKVAQSAPPDDELPF